MSIRSGKRAFNIHTVLRRIRLEVKQFADAAMFDLAEQGYATPFHQLAACIISVRTRDEVSLPAALRLFNAAPTPSAVAQLDVKKIAQLIRPASFYDTKAYNIRDLARRVTDEFHGDLPCNFEVMTSFRGVGPKCANLTLGIACGATEISVDVHVHRVTNRWGFVHAPTPEATRRLLEKRLPKKYWVEINRLLVPFGKHVCTGRLPKCSVCPVLEYCRQVGVTEHR
ncbi:MAG TPA: endonuclease III [Gemmatimonadaceae bacterium]|nr:endonuclease III [Gemmatimonadaceae bacterium]